MKIDVTGTITSLREVRTTQTGRTMNQFEILVEDGKKSWIKVITLDLELPAIAEGASVTVSGSLSVDAYIAKDGTAKGKLLLFADSVTLAQPF